VHIIAWTSRSNVAHANFMNVMLLTLGQQTFSQESLGLGQVGGSRALGQMGLGTLGGQIGLQS
jgi:hypothetical protein